VPDGGLPSLDEFADADVEAASEPARKASGIRPRSHGAYESFRPAESRWSIEQADGVRKFYRDTFGRDLPVSAYGQSGTHNRMGLDHSQSMDVALTPVGAEGRKLIEHLKANNIPFLAYDRAVKGAATNAHIHIGHPSHGLGARRPAAAASSDLPDLSEFADGAEVDTDEQIAESVNADSRTVAPPALASSASGIQPRAAQRPLNINTSEGRAERDAQATLEAQPNARRHMSVRLPQGVGGWDELTSNDAARATVRQFAEERQLDPAFVEEWLNKNGSSFKWYDRTTGEEKSPTDMIGTEHYDSATRTLRVSAEMPHLKRLERDYEASKGIVERGVDALTSDETTAGEKATAAVGGALSRLGALSVGTAGLQRSVSTSIGALAGDEESQKVMDADTYSPVNVIKATWEKLKTGSTPEGFESPIAEGLDLLYQKKNKMPLPAWRRMALEIIGDPLTYASPKVAGAVVDAAKGTRLGERAASAVQDMRGLTVLDIERAASDGRYFVVLKDEHGVTHKIETAFTEGGAKPKIKTVAPGDDLTGVGWERQEGGRVYYNGKPQDFKMEAGGLVASPVGGAPRPPAPDMIPPVPAAPASNGIRPRVGVAGRVLDVIGLPKALLASGDLSAAGRQGLLLSVTEPRIAASAMRQQFRSLVSSKAYKEVEGFLATHPDADLADASGLYRATLAKQSGSLSMREEAFMSRLAGDLPVIKQSERAYNAYLDVLRMKTFSKYADELREAGLTFESHPDEYRSIAQFIGAATGRGKLPEALDKALPVMNAIIFSPKNIASRIALLNPVTYLSMPLAARKIAMRKVVEFAALATATMTTLKYAGADVSLNPASADFLKVRIGKAHYDVLGGFQQPMRLIGRLAQGLNKISKGEKIEEGHDPVTVLANFAWSKAAPVAGYGVNYAMDRKVTGEEFDPVWDAARLAAPLVTQDLWDAYQEDGATGAMMALPAVGGIGVQTYGVAPDMKPIKPTLSAPVQAELARLGLDLDRLGPKADQSVSIKPGYKLEGVTGDNVRAFGGVTGKPGREVQGMGVDAQATAKQLSEELETAIGETINSPDYESFDSDDDRAQYLDMIIVNTHKRVMNGVRHEGRGAEMEKEKRVKERLDRMSAPTKGRKNFKL
jgi:hypothetical protein